MEFPAASALRGRVPWLGLLLAIFLLTLWIPPTTAEKFALEGQDVILRLRYTPPDVTRFIWYRGMEMTYHNFIGSLALYPRKYLTGPKYCGREEINREGSLIIRNVTVRDQDIYGVVAVLPMSRGATGFGWLSVYRLPALDSPLSPLHHVLSWVWEFSAGHTQSPSITNASYLSSFSSKYLLRGKEIELSHLRSICSHSPIFFSNPSGLIRCLWIPRTIIVSYPSYIGVFSSGPLSVPTLLASNTVVTENEDAVVMNCHTDESPIKWLFNAMSLPLRERMKLSQDHRTLTIDPVRREDAGNYQCKVSNPFSSFKSAPVGLDVKY
uniref:Ig-like domain-containing protein n=1 Tax=Myotis lucifugus TaxID=59463 RepID=G1QCH9_MYOLU